MARGVFLLLLAVLYALNETEGLRCRTDEGLSKDEMKKVTRTCMRKLTNEDSESYDEYENYDSNENSSSEYEQERSNSHSNNNHNNRGRKKYNKSSDNNKHHQNNHRNQHQGRNHQEESNSGKNGQNWNNGDYGRRYKRQMGYPYGMAVSQTYNPFGASSGYDTNRNSYSNNGFDYYQGSENIASNPSNHNNNHSNRHRTFDNSNNGNSFSTSNNNRGNYNSNSNSNDDSQSSNKSCLMQCFFEEMKMTGNEGLPDKHKVLHVITEEIRDKELRDFYSDSIQECFHILDLGNKSDKCEYSKNLVTCLSERAKTNCDDWNGNSNILFN